MSASLQCVKLAHTASSAKPFVPDCPTALIVFATGIQAIATHVYFRNGMYIVIRRVLIASMIYVDKRMVFVR